MLVVSRRDSESIMIRPDEGIDPQLTLAELFANGPIEIRIFSARDKRVTIGVEAPRQLSVWRKDAAAA